jgi:transposase
MTKTPIAVLVIDLGKNSCGLAGSDATGAVMLRKRMTRDGAVAFAAALRTCIIAMEACCGVHFLGRAFAGQRHQIRLMSPEYVEPHVKAQKTDDRDAEAIAEHPPLRKGWVQTAESRVQRPVPVAVAVGPALGSG